MHQILPGKLAALMLLAFLASSLAAQDEASRARGELQAVSSAIAEIESWLDDANQQQSAAQQRLREAELAISELQQAIENVETDIASSEAELAELRSEQGRLEQQRQSQEDLLGEILRAAYISGEHNQLKLLLSGQGPSESARMLHYSAVLSEYQLARIAEFRQTLTSLETVAQQLDESVQNLQSQRQQLALQSEQLNLARDDRALALENLRSDIANRNQELEQLQIDQAELESLIAEIARAMEGIRSFDDVPDFADSRGRLQNPLSGPLLSRFGSSYGGGSLVRQGIVIGASPGSAVRAVHPGHVVFADWLRGAGLLVIVDHGNGYMSLYGRNEALSASAGDWVDKGDMLATSGLGGENNTPGLYFEIRRNGQALDPADWLPDS